MTGKARNYVLSALALAVVTVFILRTSIPAARARTGGFAAYYTASYLLAHSPRDMARVYDDAWFAAQIPRAGIVGVHDIFNVQPPTMSLILLPLAGLPPEAARRLWTLANLGFLAGGLILLVWAMHLPNRWSLWLPALCLLYAPVRENIREGQAYLLLFFLVCLLFRALGRPRAAGRASPSDEAVAGTALGWMLVLKTGGVWLWPLLWFTGRRRVLGWATATAAAVVLLSLPLAGTEAWQAYFAQLPRLLTSPVRYVTAYQTMTSLFGRLLVYDAAYNPAPVADCPAAAEIATLAVLALTLAFSVRWARRNAARPETTLPTLALFGALMTVSAPLGEGYHCVLILPSLIVAFWWAWREKLSLGAWVMPVIAALLLGTPLHYTAPHLEAGWAALFAYPRVYVAYLLWGWLGWALCRARAETPALVLDSEEVPPELCATAR